MIVASSGLTPSLSLVIDFRVVKEVVYQNKYPTLGSASFEKKYIDGQT
jgi:hypothetical protein